jgi:hypothetical protein
VWRELRRLGRPSCAVIEAARLAAEEPSWCAYIEAQGGTRRGRSGWPVRVHKRYVSDAGLYGDPIGMQVSGIECDELVEITHVRQWEIQWPATRRRCGFLSSSESCQ